jgi:type I restriction enzyme S subunit
LPKHLADLFPDSFEDSELGEIPKGWGVKPLGELIETVKGCSYKSEELVESDTALVTLKSFARGGGYRPDGLKSFAGTYKPEQVVKPGELVIACTDVTQAAEVVGRPAVVRGTAGYRTLVASLDTLIVRPRHQSMTRAFLYFLGGTEAFVAHTYAHTTGTTVLHLAKEAVPSFKFAVPPTPLVEGFDFIASLALSRIQATEEESGILAALRDTLLPKLISGELRVKDAERFVGRIG